MSIVLELEAGGRKTGSVCPRDYRNGPSCPLIVRTSSEDVLTATVFGILRRLRPSLWLRPLLVRAFGSSFRRVPMGDLDVLFWPSVAPPDELAGSEGATEPDVLLRFGDYAVFIEAKFLSPLAERTTNDPHRDQVVRLIDVAYWSNMADRLFTTTPFVLVLGLDEDTPELVARYKDSRALADALRHHAPRTRRQIALTMAGRVAYASWTSVADIVEDSTGRAQRMERAFLADVASYLRHRVREGMQRARLRECRLVRPLPAG